MRQFDYLVAGSGLSGLYAALRASRYGKVAIVTKCNLTESNTYFAQGGIAAVTAEEDTPHFHFEDTIMAGRGLCNPKAVELLVNEGPNRIAELIEEGMHFDMEGGALALGLEGGHHRRRVLHAGGDITGRKIIEFLIKKIQESPDIEFFENHRALEILVEDSSCRGLRIWDHTNDKEELFFAKYTIIALGGASALYQRSTNPAATLGQGIALCYNAGCSIADMEFIQFHPTALNIPDANPYLISEAVRGEGAYLINKHGERFMVGVDPLLELAPRDIVAREISKQKEVYLSLSHLDPKRIKERFPNIDAYCNTHGVEFTSKIPVAPAAHYTIGGVVTDLNARCELSGLYACGEVASTGIMGANRLASNSLAECLVFGYRAIEQTLIDNLDNISNHSFIPKFSINPNMRELYLEIKHSVASILSKKVGIIRNQCELDEALKELSALENRLQELALSNEVNCTMALHNITVAKLIVEGARERKESRGAHYREEYQYEESSAYHTIQTKGENIKRQYI